MVELSSPIVNSETEAGRRLRGSGASSRPGDVSWGGKEGELGSAGPSKD